MHLRVRRSQHFARDRGSGPDRSHQMADVGKMPERSVGVAAALTHNSLDLILVEEYFVLERAGVPGPHDLHGLLRQALPFLELTGMKFDSCDACDLVHCFSVSSASLTTWEPIVPVVRSVTWRWAVRKAAGI